MEKITMLNTKLILVDGITGSGKSTTAHYIARQLEMNGISAKWFHEEEFGHPLHISDYEKKENEETLDWTARVIDESVQRWIGFQIKTSNKNTVNIIECFLFQNLLLNLITEDIDSSLIKKFAQKVFNTIALFQPGIIYLNQKNVNEALNLNNMKREKQWHQWFNESNTNTPFAKNRNLSGDDASTQIWQKLTNLSLELFEEMKFAKIKIEVSGQQWDVYHRLIANFLDIEYQPEIKINADFIRFCGTYVLGEQCLKFHTENNELFVDTFWPNMKLIEKSELEFEIEGFPTAFKFIANENGNITALQISKSTNLMYKHEEGSVLIKISP